MVSIAAMPGAWTRRRMCQPENTTDKQGNWVGIAWRSYADVIPSRFLTNCQQVHAGHHLVAGREEKLLGALMLHRRERGAIDVTYSQFTMAGQEEPLPADAS